MNLHSKPALLDSINDPADLRALPAEALKDLADELRRETVNVVSVTGGHLGAGLGVVELTVALHRVFDTPRDKLVWDVGHQSYPAQDSDRPSRADANPAAGWWAYPDLPNASESPYDTFGAAHASTSISAGLGFAVARDLVAPEAPRRMRDRRRLDERRHGL